VVSDSNPESRSALEERAQEVLQASAEQLDGRTRSRLTQARHAALDAIQQRQRSVWRWLAPVSGATATAVIAAILMLGPLKHRVDSGEVAAADELEIMTAEDSLDFYRDVEFYAWFDGELDDTSAEETGA
jgi:hypothetical protein